MFPYQAAFQISPLPANSHVTLYEYSANINSSNTSGWTSDGVTKAPDYVGTIGQVL